MTYQPYGITAPSNVPLTLVNPSAPIITPEMYIHVGDADDTASIQRALTAISNNGGGAVTLGFKSYIVNNGPIVIPANCGLVGQCGPSGTFLNGTSTIFPTQILNSSNNHTISLASLNSYCRGIVFSAPQPVFQAVITGDAISSINARYAGALTCVSPGQPYTLTPSSGAVSVITSDSAHPFSGYGLN